MMKTLLVALILILCCPILGQQNQTKYPKVVYLGDVTPQTRMTVSDVIKLKRAGLSDDLLIQQILKNNQRFDLSTNQLIQLKNASVSERVIQVMLDPTSVTVTPTTVPQPVAAPPVSTPTATPVAPTVVQHALTPPADTVPPPVVQQTAYAPVVATPTAPPVNHAQQTAASAYAPSPVVNTTGRLTDDQVRSAIIRGSLDRKNHVVGLVLNDKQTAVGSAMLAAMANNNSYQVSGYTIVVYTPEQWIESLAFHARREMAEFFFANVNETMREPNLRVVAYPSQAAYLNGVGLSMASSVHRVVLSDTARVTTIQPLEVTHESVQSNSAFRSYDYTSAGATFSMADVERIRATDVKSEFFIVVVGDKSNKFFKVKERFNFGQ
jgi:hypothetical protein